MELFGLPISQIELVDIERFCDLRIAENVSIDYKEKLSSKDPELQISKLACAFSNSLGGIALFGVKEKKRSDGRGLPDGLFGIGLGDAIEERIKQVCLNNVTPPIIPEVKTIDLSDGSGKVIVIARFVESDTTPHYLRVNGRVYLRTNDISQPLLDGNREASPDDVIWLLNRRQRPVELRNVLIKKANERLPQYEGRSLITISAIPLFPREELYKIEELTRLLRESKLTESYNCTSASNCLFVQRLKQTTLWNTFSHLEINRLGLIFYGTEARKLPPSDWHGDFANSIDITKLFHNLWMLLTRSRRLYEKADYLGLVQVELTAQNVLGLRFFLKESDFFGMCSDRDFAITRNVLVGELDSDETVKSIMREIRWSMGMGDDSFKEDVVDSYLVSIKKEQPPYLLFTR
jgi:Predicted transcriptional regulator containing an HTH domain and an uncharacterized domain shared with the mammalian protein Schlafen